jgi:hypothetical protein
MGSRADLQMLAIAIAPAAALAALAQAAPGLVWRHTDNVKAAVALAGTILLVAGWALDRAGRPHANARTRDTLLLSLALLAGLCWWNLGLFHRNRYIHEWDTYHYYMGAKYFPELGYLRLYHCTVVADAEHGLIDASGQRTVRDLENNRVVSARSLAAEPERCTRHFTAARWAAFKDDLTWFRERIAAWRWPRAQQDHGFNATPVWLILGRGLTATGPASDRQMLALTLIDAGLLVGMWGAAAWAFGWRATCVALLYWGTNFPAFWGWTGGGFLRQDWLLLSVLGLALLRRGHPAPAGAAIAVAGLLRVFPWLIVGGLGLKACWAIWERRSLAPLAEYRGFATGFALALLLLVPAAAMVNGGWDVWRGFIANSAKHASTPAVNYMGLRSLMAYDHDRRVTVLAGHGLEDDAFRIWRAARVRVLSERRPLFLAAAATLICLLALGVRRQPDWIAAVLGVGLVPILTEISCYYYGLLLAFGFIGAGWPPVGVALVGLAALTWLLQSVPGSSDTIYASISAAVLGFVVLASAVSWWSARHTTGPAAGEARVGLKGRWQRK